MTKHKEATNTRQHGEENYSGFRKESNDNATKKQEYSWSQQNEEEEERNGQEEAIKAIKTKNETPKDQKAKMEDLYPLFPDEMEKLLGRLDGGEISQAELLRELDDLMEDIKRWNDIKKLEDRGNKSFQRPHE